MFSPREWAAPQRNFSPSRRWHTQGMSIKKITEAAFSCSTDMADRIVPLRQHIAKYVIDTHLTLHSTVHGHRQHTCTPERAVRIFKSAQRPIFASPKPENGPQAVFCFERAANWQKTKCKNGCPFFEKIDAFLRCALFLRREAHSSKHMPSNNVHVLVNPLFFLSLHVQTFMFFLTPKRRPKPRKKAHVQEPIFRNWAPIPHNATDNVVPKEPILTYGGDPQTQKLARHIV